MYSSFLTDSEIVAEIQGTEGKIFLGHKWFCPGKIKLIHNNGTEKIFEFDVKSNGYEYEAEETVKCILAGKTQSDLWNWDQSMQLVGMMDKIRKDCGIFYPGHDE
jgi:scyllo-inositol 2-dehydrogenase (NADP+)